MLKKKSWIWGLSLIGCLLAGCLARSGVSDSDPLAGSNWRLVSINSAGPLAPTESLSLQFDNQGFLRGSTGCNEFNGSYQASQGRFRLGSLAVTERACLDPARMDQERRYLDALAQVDSYFLVDGDQILLLSSQDNGPQLEFLRQ